MAIYVTSDAHGHVRALDEALSKISLTSDDTLYVLGDMIDRGPDPVGVIKLVRSLPNAHVLKGNHEQIMLDAIIGPGSARCRDLGYQRWLDDARAAQRHGI